MADGENTNPRNEESTDSKVPHGENSEPTAEFVLEMRDALPGDRAIMGVEQEGIFVWLASRKYVHPKVAAELEEQLQRIVREGWWEQRWPGVC